MKQITEAIAATSEIMGRAISPVACAMMAKKLAAFPKPVVMQALDEVSEGKGFLTFEAVKNVIERINPDGRPGADEAWAMIPRDEATSVVMTEEMAEAMGIAQPLLDEGDQVAARMAFKAAYDRITDANKRSGIKPKWFPSLGHDKNGREAVLVEAVRLGRIDEGHAVMLLPPALTRAFAPDHDGD